MKTYLLAAVAVAFTFTVIAEDKKTDPAKPATAPPPPPVVAKDFDTVLKEASYAVGVNIGSNWKRQEIDLNLDEVNRGLRETLAGSAKITEPQAQEAIMTWQKQLNKKKAEKFLAENGKKTGVKTTASGLQYEVLVDGTGKIPTANDKVAVHYRGTLITGQEFDSSYKNNRPAEFPVTGVIKGWIEALQLMKTGSKWKLYIHPDLAYGENGRPTIPPNSLLIFEVELLEIKGQEKPAAAAKGSDEKISAVSGEIIKVPSAEELKKGAKIEVLKEEDVKKLTATNSATAKQPAPTPK